MITRRFVCDSKYKVSGNFIEFVHPGPKDYNGTALLIRKIEYPNLTYFVDATNNIFSMSINGLAISVTLPLQDIGSGKNVCVMSLDDIAEYITNRSFEQYVGILPANTTMSCKRVGRRFTFEIQYPRAIGDPITTYTLLFSGTLALQMGFNSPTPSDYYTATYSYWSFGFQKLVWISAKCETLSRDRVRLCSKKLSSILDNQDPDNPWLIAHLPLDLDASPGEKLTYIPINETRVIPYRGDLQDFIDFFVVDDFGARLGSNQDKERLIVTFDIYHGDLSEMQRVII